MRAAKLFIRALLRLVHDLLATCQWFSIVFSIQSFCRILFFWAAMFIDNFLLYFVRSVKKSEEDIPVPPLVKSAALWGMPNTNALYH